MLDPVPSARAPRAGWFLAAVSLAAVLALGNLPLLTGHASPKWDAADLFEPMFALVGDAARSGHLLKWDPWSGAGSPDWAQPEFGTTSPVLLAFSAVPINPLHAYIAYWLSVWFFGGLGMLFLAKHFGCSPPGAAIIACGFAASGFFTGHAEHMSSIYSVSYLPWILWRFDAGLKARDWRRGAEAGALYGLSALGGYPEFTILTPGFLALWAMARVLAAATEELAGTTEPGGAKPHTVPSCSGGRPGPVPASTDRRRAGIAALRAWAAAMVIGAAIFAPPYAGLWFGTRGYTDYIGPRPRDVALSSNLLPAGALATLASPSLATLNTPPAPIWPATDISMTSAYMGAGVVVLAVFALRRRRWRWYVAAVGAFFLCCALGSQLPLRGWLYDLAPPTRYFRNPSLFRAYVILLAGVLAALGARDLAQSGAALRLRLWRIAAVLGGIAAGVFAIVTKTAGKSLAEPGVALAHFCAVWGGIAALSFLLKAGRISSGRFVQVVAALACLDAVGSLYLSRSTIWDDSSPGLRAANAAHRTTWILSGLDRALLPPPSVGGTLNNRNSLLKQPVFDDYTSHQIFRNGLQKEILADPLLNRMATGSARIWFSPAPLWSTPDEFNLQMFRAHARQKGPDLILHSPAAMLGISRQNSLPPVSPEEDKRQLVPCVPAAVTGLIYQPDRLAFRFEAPAAGYLLVTDRWADGWEASVNGQTRPVLGADFIYRAVAVDAGANSIQFDYRPAWFWPALALSWGTLIVLGVWKGYTWWIRMPRAKRSRAGSPLLVVL